MAPQFALNHIPAVFLGTTLSLGGMLPLFRAKRAILELGLPPRIAQSTNAQTVMKVGMARSTCLGFAIWAFYLQGKLEAVDTLLSTLGYLGAIDMYICWKEGKRGVGTFRGACGVALSAWGWLGMTAWV